MMFRKKIGFDQELNSYNLSTFKDYIFAGCSKSIGDEKQQA